MKTYRQLIEEISSHRVIDMPHSLRHPVERTYAKSYRRIEAQIEQYHRTGEQSDLREAMRLALRQIETMDDDIIKLKLAHEHEARRARYKLASITQIKKEREQGDEDI
jgi:hypothetical protein